ncbi:MAG TPA: T9SS type A sorting domain-containing protein [Fluviicola sp.]|nr:T9SS type A sorting domain-containing protein [Fluviicola sp.]
MKQFVFLIAFLSLVTIGNAQSWNFVGSSVGYNASEVDIEITPNGQLYMAYIDTDNSSKITVRKWVNNSWQLVGAAGQGTANAFDLQLAVSNEDYPVVSAKCMYSSYEILEIYKWSGATWDFQGIGDPMWTYHADDYSLRVNTGGQTLITYNNRTNTYTLGLITINLSTLTQLGAGASGDLDQGNFGNAVTSWAGTGNNVTVVHEENDMGDYLPFDQFNGSVWNNYGLSGIDGAEKMKAEKGTGTTNICTVWKNADATPVLKFKAFNGSTFGTEFSIHTSTLIQDFDFDTQNDNAFVFYRNSTTCYFKQLSGTMAPSSTTITSGATLAPSNATSLAAETYYGVHVIAYVSSGKCLVKEYNQAANIEDYDNLSMCEGTSFNNGGDYTIVCLDPNFSHTNMTMTCTSQNTSVLPQSAITITPSADNLTWYLTISTTNDVSTPTIVDLEWILMENGVQVGSLFVPVTINPSPNIQFIFPNATVCENASPISLVNKVTPQGGTWSGAGVQNNILYPGYSPVSSPTDITLSYTKTNIYGCTSASTVDVTIAPAPVLNVTTIDADCNSTNGGASVVVSEGLSPYDIYWSSGSTQPSVTNLPAGQYFLSVTDDNGCLSTQSVLIGTDGITQTAALTNVSCAGETDGAINLTVTGASGTLTYAWSNGATTQDLTNIAAGPYEVSVTDQNGCVSTSSYVVTEPQAIIVGSLTTTVASCATSNGTANIQFVGGTQPYNYSWFDSQETNLNVSTGTLTNAAAGMYSSVVTDANGCSLTTTVMISNANGPVIAIDTIIASSCANDGAIELVNIGNNAQTFLWSNGATTQNISGLAPGLYVVEATSGNGCTTMLSAQVEAALPEAIDICLVTVDTSTNTNLVVWEKPASQGTIESFNIYRETSQAGLYQLIGNVPYADESIYNDLVASPSVRSWRYKISSVDACGVESEISENHKTIHLVINLGLGDDINLSWDSYEGFAFPEFVIKRHTDVDGWTTLAQMPTNLFTYTDTPPTTDGLVYLVTVDPPAMCTSTKSLQQDFNSARSNKDNRLQTADASLDELLAANVQVYPNPTNGEITLENSTSETVTAKLYDASGRMLATIYVAPGSMQTDVSFLDSGMYQVVFTSGQARTSQKLSVTH